MRKLLLLFLTSLIIASITFWDVYSQGDQTTFISVQFTNEGITFYAPTPEADGILEPIANLPSNFGLADLNPSAEWIIASPQHLVSSPDFQQIAFTAESNQEVSLFIYAIMDSSLQQFSIASAATQPVWSPDGSAILLRPVPPFHNAAPYPELQIVELMSGTSSTITQTPDFIETVVAWVPDSSGIVYASLCEAPCTSGSRELYFSDRDGSTQRLLTDLTSALPEGVISRICNLRFNPDDQRWYYVTGCLPAQDFTQDRVISTNLAGDNRVELDLAVLHSIDSISIRQVDGLFISPTGIYAIVQISDIGLTYDIFVYRLVAPQTVETVFQLTLPTSGPDNEQLVPGHSLSPNGHQLALALDTARDGSGTVFFDGSSFSTIRILDTSTGQVVSRAFAEPNYFLCNPRWVDNQTYIAEQTLGSCTIEGEIDAIIQVDSETGSVTDVSDGLNGIVTLLPLTEGPKPPTADAGPDQTLMDSDDDGSELVTLDGSGSSDVDGTIESYVWSENDVEIATGVSPQVSLSVGVHTITLTVTDDDGATDTDEVVITVNPPAAASTLTVQVGQSSSL